MGMPFLGKCIARTTSAEEAHKLARDYEMKGYEARVFEKGQAGIIMYEVWVFKEKQGLI